MESNKNECAESVGDNIQIKIKHLNDKSLDILKLLQDMHLNICGNDINNTSESMKDKSWEKGLFNKWLNKLNDIEEILNDIYSNAIDIRNHFPKCLINMKKNKE